MVIVGLGNPGKKYSKTRHNSGYIFVDEIAKEFQSKFKLETKLHGEVCEFKYNNENIVLLKPITFMNDSGLSVKAYLDYYHVNIDDLIVVYDDMDIDVGNLRLRKNGSSGGQKGMKSIISTIGTEEFKRIRIGIGKNTNDVIDYVLSPVSKNENPLYQSVIDKAPQLIKDLVDHDFDYVMNHYNGHGE